MDEESDPPEDADGEETPPESPEHAPSGSSGESPEEDVGTTEDHGSDDSGENGDGTPETGEDDTETGGPDEADGPPERREGVKVSYDEERVYDDYDKEPYDEEHAETAEAGPEAKQDGGTAGGVDGIPGPAADQEAPFEEVAPAGQFVDDPEGPDADAEMPLTAHIEEMLKRLLVVVAVAGVVSVATYPFTERIINFLWDSILNQSTRPRLYGVLELLFTKLKVASLAGLIVALPVVVYEAYQFMKPGLYPHERRYYLAAIPTSLVLALLGVTFAYFVVLPAVFMYFLNYSRGVAIIGFSLGRTFDLILALMGYLAVVFQIPLFLLLAMMMGVVTRQWLADRRLLFWGGFLGASFLLFGPTDPTGASPFLVTITMILLFEATLFLVKWTRRARS